MMTTERSELIGGFVTPEIKQAVREEAAELTKQEGQRVSVSSLLHRILRERYAHRPPQIEAILLGAVGEHDSTRM